MKGEAGRLAASFRHALRGVGELLRTQPNARIEAALAAAAFGLAGLLRLAPQDWALLALAAGLVLAAECANSALEALADRVSAERDSAIGRAKDMAAGAVLLAAFAALLVGLFVLGPPLLGLLRG